MVVLSLLFGSSYALTIAWDANTEPDLAGYKIYYGTGTRDYQHIEDVGNVTQVTLDIPWSSYIAATAYDTDGNESGYSNEIYYGAIRAASGGQIYTSEIGGATAHGDGYEVIWQNGTQIIIHDFLPAGSRIRLHY